MKATINKLEPSIASLIHSMDKLAEKVGDVHENHGELHTKVERYVSKLVGAILGVGARDAGYLPAALAAAEADFRRLRDNPRFRALAPPPAPEP